MQSCIVHWDLENARIRSGVSVSYTCNSIRTALAANNIRVVQGYVYLDSAREPLDLRSELSHMGWNIVDCVCKRKPEGVDKRIIANICTSPLTYGTDCVVGLISKDTDFCYSLNLLRNGGVRTVLITEVDVRTSSMLTSSADVHVTVDFVPPAQELPPDLAGPAGPPERSVAAATLLWACSETPALESEGQWLKAAVGQAFHDRFRATHGKLSPADIRAKFKEAIAELVAAKEMVVQDPTHANAILKALPAFPK